ncbi:MAG: DUF4332 domain-containing protein [Anaerolineae bacterium]|nr:DUF4332 domain-containing protein [Anaerolineae bacterium]
MLRYPRFLTLLLLLVPFLSGVSPYQQAGGFTWQWWYWLCLIGLLVVGLLLFISLLAGRQAPPPPVEPERYPTTLSHTPAPPPPAPAVELEHPAPVESETPSVPAPEPTPEPVVEPTAAADPLAAPTSAPEPEPMVEPVSFAPEPAAVDDLTRIEGIGPKISELLQAAGIGTFAGLAAASPDQLKEILEAAGPQFRLADPISWPEQAGLAAAGDWDRLQTLQDTLKGGREVAS